MVARNIPAPAPRGAAQATESFRAALSAQHAGDDARAHRLLTHTLEAVPTHFGALCGLGLLYLRHGRAGDGLPLVQRALQQQPGSADGWQLCAALLQALGRIPEAIDAYESALKIRPDLAAASSNLAGLHAEQGRHDAALAWYERALAARPDFAEAHNNMGVSLTALDRPQEALEHYARALALRPDFADAQGNRGAALVALGRLAEAATSFEAAIRLAPRVGRFYLDLAGCRPFVPGDPHLAGMQALLRSAGALAVEDRIQVHFALGKALEAAGDWRGAFEQFRRGNALKRVHTVYDEAGTLRMLREAGRLFTSDLLARARDQGEPSETPVFILGMPRSGTTLVEQILASHPAVFGAGERPDLHRLALRYAGAGSASGLAARLAGLPPEQLRLLGGDYVRGLAGAAPQARRITDKMPGNFLHVGLIGLALPQARIIHVQRDPVDTCLSCFSTLFSGDQPYSYNLGELGRYYRGYAELMRHWRATLPAGQLLEIRYEDVVTDLEAQARRMVAHCGLDWDAACLRFQATQRSVQTASKAQVRQPLYRGSIGRWRRYESLLGPLLEALGPERSRHPGAAA